MGIFERKKKTENRAAGEVEFEDALLRAIMGGGGKVTKEMALQVPTVSGGVDLIANIIASTPIKLYRDAGGKAEEIKDDARVALLNDDTGDTLNANEFWHAMVRDYYLGKGGYAYIKKAKGEFAGLYYVDEEQVAINMYSDPIFKNYDIQVNGQSYHSFDFLKILRNTKDGAKGKPITEESSMLIAAAYQSLMLEFSMAKRGGTKKGFFKAERSVDDAGMQRLRQAYKDLYDNGTNNAMVLNKGIDFTESSDTAAEMQLNENKRANAEEFSKIFHISAETIGGKNLNTSEIAKLAAAPLMAVIQCALNRDFLLEKEKKSLYWAFDTKELLKGDMRERFEAYKTALEGNFMQIDEVRYAEDLPPLGLTWIKLGLQDVLYDPESKTIYTPNTNKVSTMNENDLQQEGEGDTPSV